MTLDLTICGLRIRFHTPFPVTITEETAPFVAECYGQPDLDFYAVPVPHISLPDEPGTDIGYTRYYKTEHGWDTYYLLGNGTPYCKVSRQKFHREIECLYLPDHLQLLKYSRDLLTLLELETVLLHFGGMILHASVVAYQGEGILFTAPSGTGKSTQAMLWQTELDAEILNGDRGGLRFVDGKWWVFGLPYAGSSRIYRAASVDLKAIVILRQSDSNRARRISGFEALRGVFPEFNLHRWDDDFMSDAMDLLDNMLQHVKVFSLDCRPDADAVKTLFEVLQEEQDR